MFKGCNSKKADIQLNLFISQNGMLENYNFLIPIKNILPHNVTGLMIVLFPASNASRTFLTKSSPGFL